MADQNCENCAWRAKYDNNPKSLMGKLWRWHINFCPGWKSYMTSLSQEDKFTLADKYSFKKYV